MAKAVNNKVKVDSEKCLVTALQVNEQNIWQLIGYFKFHGMTVQLQCIKKLWGKAIQLMDDTKTGTSMAMVLIATAVSLLWHGIYRYGYKKVEKYAGNHVILHAQVNVLTEYFDKPKVNAFGCPDALCPFALVSLFQVYIYV